MVTNTNQVKWVIVLIANSCYIRYTIDLTTTSRSPVVFTFHADILFNSCPLGTLLHFDFEAWGELISQTSSCIRSLVKFHNHAQCVQAVSIVGHTSCKYGGCMNEWRYN